MCVCVCVCDNTRIHTHAHDAQSDKTHKSCIKYILHAQRCVGVVKSFVFVAAAVELVSDVCDMCRE